MDAHRQLNFSCPSAVTLGQSDAVLSSNAGNQFGETVLVQTTDDANPDVEVSLVQHQMPNARMSSMVGIGKEKKKVAASGPLTEMHHAAKRGLKKQTAAKKAWGVARQKAVKVELRRVMMATGAFKMDKANGVVKELQLHPSVRHPMMCSPTPPVMPAV